MTTRSGARGLEEGAGVAFLQADSPEAFGECLVRVLRDGAQAKTFAERGAAFAVEYYHRSVQALARAVNSTATR